MGTLRHPIRLSGLLAVLLIGPLHAQDLSGTWRGELVRGMNERFVIEMELVADAGRITGTSHVTFPFQQEHFANMAIEGQGQGGVTTCGKRVSWNRAAPATSGCCRVVR